jgi:glycosyltransferase involved in cell wall biosynthesis
MITFAIPYYSGRDYLVRAIRSVLAQRDVEWQALVCDDGPDSTVEQVVHEAGEGRIRYVRNPTNLGMAGNWNRCLDIVETDLVTLLHGDDELAPSYGARMTATLDAHPRAAAAFCRYDVIDAQGARVFSVADEIKRFFNPAYSTTAVIAGERGMRALLRANFIGCPTLCYRKSVLGARRFSTQHKFVPDWLLTTLLLLDGDELVGIPDVAFHYRRHEAQATERLTRGDIRFREEIGFYEHMRELVAERG